eukprot:jgi/Botrbrau1/4467/Bobra.0220s0001.1
MAPVIVNVAVLLAFTSAANCRPMWRVLLSYATLQGDRPGESGPRTGTPYDPPSGSVNKNIMGNTVKSGRSNGPTVCADWCATVQGATYYNYCNLEAMCGSSTIGTCDCKAASDPPQYYSDSTSSPGDGWISGPVSKLNAGGGSNFFTDPIPQNLKGTTLNSYELGADSSMWACQDKCKMDSNCKGYNTCAGLDANTGCGSFAKGHCDTKTWPSGDAQFYSDSTTMSGDGWYSAHRTNLS